MNKPLLRSFLRMSLRGVPEGRRSNPLRFCANSRDCFVAPSSLLAMTHGSLFLLAFFILHTSYFILPAQAQVGATFGKNKVEYKDFHWQFIQSPHFDVYFYQGG